MGGSRRKKRGARSDAAALLRAGLIGAGASFLIWLVPPLRHTARAAAVRLAEAIEISRLTDARRVAAGKYALRYGISYELSSAIYQAALAEGIDPELAYRLISVESSFRERAMSPVGAIGLTQLMPTTAAELQPGITRQEIFDRETNLRLGLRYLRWLLEVYGGDLEDALHAYNRGPGTVDRIRAAGGDPDNGYARRVLGASAEPYLAPLRPPAPARDWH